MLAISKGFTQYDVLYNLAIIILVIGFVILFFSRKFRTSSTWKATVTPLASIIGSGFLVVTPLFMLILGKYALFAIIGMVCMAYVMGYIMRFNIFHIESDLGKPSMPSLLIGLERFSYFSLSTAYLISIPFYIKLLSLFFLRGVNMHNGMISNWVATILLAFIGITGKLNGFKHLESLEEYAVNIKLSIIFSMLFALLIFNINLVYSHHWILTVETPIFDIETIRKLLGTIIIIQGFETSRFLSLNYKPEMRTRTMRYAQIISAVIYILFVGLSMVVFDTVKHITETSIIDVSMRISLVLPYLLVIAAIMSQFSAAIADTVSAGGLLHEASLKRFKPNNNYLLISAIAIILTWSVNIFQIISLASRAFAFYYAIQSLEATIAAYKKINNLMSILRVILFALMFCFMLMITIFGISV